jgi:hypothetical protein
VKNHLFVRIEHLAVLAVAIVLGLTHLRDIDWLRFIAAFVAIDLIGYLPGALAARRRPDRIAPVFHHLYNVTHSYLTLGLVLAAWALLHGGPEWAMLAIPIHLSGDRGLFGNGFKPASLPFEPATQGDA